MQCIIDATLEGSKTTTTTTANTIRCKISRESSPYKMPLWLEHQSFKREFVVRPQMTIQSALQNAFFRSNWNMMRDLLSQGAFINFRYGYEGDPLIFYCRSRKKVKELVEMGADINAQNYNGLTLLGNAIQQGWSLDSVSSLLEYGANVNCPASSYGYSPLGLVILHQPKNIKLLKLMLEYKANISASDTYLYLNIKISWKQMIVKYVVWNNLELDLVATIEVDEYLQACLEEISLMKQHIIYRSMSLYSYLKKNYKFRGNIESSLVLQKFRIYASVILEEMERVNLRVNQRKKLLNDLTAITVHDSGQARIGLNYDSTFIIAEFLNNVDLENLNIAFNNNN